MIKKKRKKRNKTTPALYIDLQPASSSIPPRAWRYIHILYMWREVLFTFSVSKVIIAKQSSAHAFIQALTSSRHRVLHRYISIKRLHICINLVRGSARKPRASEADPPWPSLPGQRPPGQEETLLQRPDGERGGHVLQRGAGLRAADLGEGLPDRHVPRGGEDTGASPRGLRSARLAPRPPFPPASRPPVLSPQCKTYACIMESHLMGLTVDFGMGFVCFDAASKVGAPSDSPRTLRLQRSFQTFQTILATPPSQSAVIGTSRTRALPYCSEILAPFIPEASAFLKDAALPEYCLQKETLKS